MGETVGLVLSLLLVAGCIAVLAAMVRFSILSRRRTRGAARRLHAPERAEVEAKWNVKLPPAIDALYKSPLVEVSWACLAAPGPGMRRWRVDRFIPLTVRDLSEWLKITGVPGLPIAIDEEKGTYYLPFEPLRNGATVPVLLRLAGRKREDVQVAESVEEFAKFERTEAAEE